MPCLRCTIDAARQWWYRTDGAIGGVLRHRTIVDVYRSADSQEVARRTTQLPLVRRPWFVLLDQTEKPFQQEAMLRT